MDDSYKLQRRELRPGKSRRPRSDPDRLTHSEELFALEYLANGYNATAAYKAVHPRASQRTAEVNGSRILRKAEVSRFVAGERAARKKRLRVFGDEALELISLYARADIGALFKDGRLMKLDEMPLNVRRTIKSIRDTTQGPVIVLHDAMEAARLMAIADGELSTSVKHAHSFDHAAYLGAEPPPED